MLDILRDILAVLGGGGIVVIGLSKLVGGVLRDRIKEKERMKTEKELELNRQRFDLRRIQPNRFADSQFDVYVNLWQTLQGLSLAVDALWHRATRPNIVTLANQLAETKIQVQNWSFFFDDQHLQELRSMFETLENFQAGKTRLIDMRSQEKIKDFFTEEFRRQIYENKEYKDRFNDLLSRMHESFRNKLSGFVAA